MFPNTNDLDTFLTSIELLNSTGNEFERKRLWETILGLDIPDIAKNIHVDKMTPRQGMRLVQKFQHLMESVNH